MTNDGEMTLAHGVGTRTDLPLPAFLVYYGAGAAILVSVVVLLLIWRKPKLGQLHAGWVTPSELQRLIDVPWFRALVQAAALVIAVLITVVALVGPAHTSENVAPWALYITLWVGLVPASLVLGPVWGYVNPLRLVHRGLAAFTGEAPAARRLEHLGMWPAALSMLIFVWLELIHPDGAAPTTVGTFLVLYAVGHLIASLWFGEGWFAHADAFEVYSALVGRCSPWGRRDDGQLVLRNPLINARAQPPVPGLPAVIVVLLGSTAFDGLTRTEFWQMGFGAGNDTVSGTLGLLVTIALIGLCYVAATGASGTIPRPPASGQPGRYAHTIIPVFLGYTIAHYFSLLLIDGQKTLILASNPFGVEGTDLLGTYGNAVDYTVVSPDAIAHVQVGAIVLGHMVATVLAHEQALRSSEHARGLEHLPLAILMVMFTVLGLWLLFGF